MKGSLVITLAATLSLWGGLAAGVVLAQSQGGLSSLRSGTDVTATPAAPPVLRQSKPATGFARAYRQQPPLIPHAIDGYQVTKSFNKCMTCHTWPQNANYGAPKVSETHYESREGIDLDEVSPLRWFCTQCHVVQADARPLVPNAFKNAREMDGAFSQ